MIDEEVSECRSCCLTKDGNEFMFSDCESPTLVSDLVDIEMMDCEGAAENSLAPTHRRNQYAAPPTHSRRRRRRQNRVSFCESALVYGSTRTTEDVQESWYTKAEITTFKNQRREIVSVLKRRNFDVEQVSVQHCLRGFEAYFSIETNKATKAFRAMVVSLVFAEQNRQRDLGIVDKQLLRVASQRASSWALRNALDVASKDALYAMQNRILENHERQHGLRQMRRQQLQQEYRHHH